MPFFQHVSRRSIFISLAFGLTICVLCFIVGWQRSGDPSNYLDGNYYWDNKAIMDSIDHRIESWLKSHDSLPESLQLLDCDDVVCDELRTNQQGRVCDSWGNPIIYKVEGGDYELTSYGEDGKPGGVWFASDISNRKPLPPDSFPPPLGVFWSSEIANNMAISSVLAGLLCFFSGLAILSGNVQRAELSELGQVKPNKHKASVILSRLASLVLIAIFALGVSFALGTIYLVRGEYH